MEIEITKEDGTWYVQADCEHQYESAHRTHRDAFLSYLDHLVLHGEITAAEASFEAQP